VAKSTRGAGWACERCGRQFANANQNHSCKPPVPIATHFEGRPAWMRKNFETIANKLGKSIRVDGVAKGIHLAAHSTFAGITTTKTKMRVEFLHYGFGADAELIAWLKASRDEHGTR